MNASGHIINAVTRPLLVASLSLIIRHTLPLKNDEAKSIGDSI